MFSFEPTNFFPKDPAVLIDENPEYFAKTCTALDIGIKSVEKIMSRALAVSVSLLKAAAEKAAAEKAAEQAAVEGIMKHLVVPLFFRFNYDCDLPEFDETRKQLPYYHGMVEDQPYGKYSLRVQTKAGFDVCFHNVKITGKGTRWFFAEKITINGKFVAADFLREEFGLRDDLLMIKFYC